MQYNTDKNFWPSYSDFITSLFFIMLVLFVLSYSSFKKKEEALILAQDSLKVQLTQFKWIQEVENANQAIDSNLFTYRMDLKKYVMKIFPSFPAYHSDIKELTDTIRKELLQSGRSIKKLTDSCTSLNPSIKFLIIIEGQASKDNYPQNFQLSYERALSLIMFWKKFGIHFNSNCELLIAGSGIYGVPRDKIEYKNQRFLVHIIPKAGNPQR